MSGQLQSYADLAEKDHERINDIEDELISLRRMMERIGREKRTCVMERIIPYLLVVLIVSLVAFGIVFILLDKVR